MNQIALVRALVGVLTCWALGACAGDAETGGASVDYERRDSAGVTIVVNHAPAWGPGADWTLDPVPVVDLGGAAVAEPELFSGVSGLDFLSDGSIVVLNDRPRDVRIFEPDGTYRTRFGRGGEGPGEFGTFSGMNVLPGDTIAIMDEYLGRRTDFLPDGTVLSERSLEMGRLREEFPGIGGWGGETDRWVLRSGATLTSSDPGIPPASAGTGIVHSPMTVVFGVPNLTDAREVGPFPGRAGPVEQPGRGFMADFLYGPVSVWTASAHTSTIHLHPAGTSEVHGLDPDGTLRQIARLPLGPQPFTEAMERYPWGLVGAKTREEWDAFARNGFLVADSLPLTFRILTDPSDRVWLVDPAASADPAALGFFQVIDADGRWLGRVDVPLRIDPVTALRIGEDRIAVVERDELDVEHVRVYLIRRGG